MKITLDLSKLVEDGKLTAEEAERLKTLASQETGSLAVNILIGFGVISIALGAVSMLPSVVTIIVVGLILFAAGLATVLKNVTQWAVFGQILLVTGALMFSGGVIGEGEGSVASMLIVTASLAAASIVARSSLLAALAVIALSATLGARTGYSHATYSLAIFEPTLTILLFSGLALAAYWGSLRLKADYERLAIMVARTSVLLVNFGFWVGSLWGDPLFLLRGFKEHNPVEMMSNIVVPSWVFGVGWAFALIGAALWAVTVNRRWLVNIAAAFGAIHFYTQWFEYLGATPASVLGGGVLMLVVAYGLWMFNKKMAAPSTTAKAA
jgi:iron complex transport system permease protein